MIKAAITPGTHPGALEAKLLKPLRSHNQLQQAEEKEFIAKLSKNSYFQIYN